MLNNDDESPFKNLNLDWYKDLIPKMEIEDLSLSKYQGLDVSKFYDELDFEPIDLSESSGMNALHEMMLNKQNEIIDKQTETVNKQTETVNKLIEVIANQQNMIDDARKGSVEARVYSIVSIAISIIAIVIAIWQGL